MSKLIFILFISMSACSTITWTGQCGSISRTGFATDVHAQTVSIEIGPDCSHRIVLGGASSDQSEALKAVAEGAVKGAMKGAAP